MVDVNLLDYETRRRGYTHKDVAENALHITPQAYGKKRRGESKFTTDDADNICDFLGITDLLTKAKIFLVQPFQK